MDRDTALLFTRQGLGDGPADLQMKLAQRFLSLLLEAGTLPGRVLCYTDGVRLACAGSPVLDQLHALEGRGVEIILCQTCLDTFGLTDQVAVGIVGGMPDIITALQRAAKVISL